MFNDAVNNEGYIASVTDVLVDTKCWWTNADRGKYKFSNESVSHSLSSTKPTYFGLGLRMGLRGQRPAPEALRYIILSFLLHYFQNSFETNFYYVKHVKLLFSVFTSLVVRQKTWRQKEQEFKLKFIWKCNFNSLVPFFTVCRAFV